MSNSSIPKKSFFGFIYLFFKSIGKSRKLRNFQLKLAPDNSAMDDLESWAGNYVEKLKTGELDKEKTERQKVMQEYLKFCVSDEGVKLICREYKLSANDLEELSKLLSGQGLGQWIKGHYVPLSTIAYPEPLLYFVESERMRENITDKDAVNNYIMTVLSNLLDYWGNSIPDGGLIQIISNEEEVSESFLRVRGLWKDASSDCNDEGRKIEEESKDTSLYSKVGLLYPLGALYHIWDKPISFWMKIGYGISNLGYLLIFAGILEGTFLVFGLRKKISVFAVGVVILLIGVALSNPQLF